VHAFASTEAGVGFEVGDALAGFPASLIGRDGAGVEMRSRTARCGFARREPQPGIWQPLRDSPDADGFVDTGDIVELRGERYYFVGRRDGVINVGGQKVHPEEVEAVINSHPQVRISQVRAKKNAIMGALVVADVVLNGETGAANARGKGLEHAILEHCRAALPGTRSRRRSTLFLPWPLPDR